MKIAVKFLLALISLALGYGFWWAVNYLLLYPVNNMVQYIFSPWILGIFMWLLCSAIIYKILVKLVIKQHAHNDAKPENEF